MARLFETSQGPAVVGASSQQVEKVDCEVFVPLDRCVRGAMSTHDKTRIGDASAPPGQVERLVARLPALAQATLGEKMLLGAVYPSLNSLHGRFTELPDDIASSASVIVGRLGLAPGGYSAMVVVVVPTLELGEELIRATDAVLPHRTWSLDCPRIHALDHAACYATFSSGNGGLDVVLMCITPHPGLARPVSAHDVLVYRPTTLFRDVCRELANAAAVQPVGVEP